MSRQCSERGKKHIQEIDECVSERLEWERDRSEWEKPQRQGVKGSGKCERKTSVKALGIGRKVCVNVGIEIYSQAWANATNKDYSSSTVEAW